MNIGKIEGGDWASSVPCWCRLDCRIFDLSRRVSRPLSAGDQGSLGRVARADRFLANNPPMVTFNGFHAEGYVQPPGTEAEAVLARAHQAATGRELQSFMTPGYLDTRVYALYDKIPALCYGPISENITASTSASAWRP